MRSAVFIAAGALVLLAGASVQQILSVPRASWKIEDLFERPEPKANEWAKPSPADVRRVVARDSAEHRAAVAADSSDRSTRPGLGAFPDSLQTAGAASANGNGPGLAASDTVAIRPGRAKDDTLKTVKRVFLAPPAVADAEDSTGEEAPVAKVLRARYRSTDSVSVRLASDAILSAKPKEILTAVFAVGNSGERCRSVTASIDVPAGWIVVRAPSHLSLDPGASSIQFVTLKIPAEARAGDFAFELSLEDQATRSFLASASVLVTIQTVYDLSLELQSQPDFVAAGDEYEVVMLVANYGNVPNTIELSTGPSSAGEVHLDARTVDLDPGQFREVRARVQTVKVERPTAERFNVTASIVGQPGVRSFVSSGVDVIPVYGRLRPPTDPLSVVVTVGGVGDGRRGGALYSAEGNGEIFGGRLAFDLRFPDQRDVARFGRRDEYQSSFRTKDVSIVVGDQSFNLSPLTTSGDYAFGAGSTVRTGLLEIDAFAQQSRESILDYSLFGGALSLHPDEQTAVGVNMLHRDGLYDGTITTIRGMVAPFDGASLDMECGIDDGEGIRNPACAVALVGRTSRIAYRGRLFRTGETYPGSANQLTQGSAGLEYRIPSGWSFRADLDGQDRGGNSAVARNHFGSVTGVGYRRRFGQGAFNGDLQLLTSRQDFTGGRLALDRTERTLRFSSGYQMPYGSVSLAIDVGHAESESQVYSGSLDGQRFRVQARPGRAYDVSGFVEHLSGFASLQPISVDRWFSGFGAGWMPRRKTRIRADFTRSLDNGVSHRTYTSFDGRLDYELFWGHHISAQIRRSVDDGRYRSAFTDYRFGYSVPLSVPLPNTSRSPRKVFGRVYDRATGRGIEGVLLHLGDRMTLTDENGRFRFPAPVLETEYLRVNQRSIGIDRVSGVAMPYPVNRGDRDVEVDIPISPGATLSGVVTRYGSPLDRTLVAASDPIEPIEDMRGVIVEARSGGRVFRVSTNERGRFVFRNIPPGEYVVRIVRARIPSQHKWEADHQEVDLQPAEDRTVRFKLVPIRRRIHLIEGGAVRLAPGSTENQ